MSEGKQVFKIIDPFLARITVKELEIRGWLKCRVHFEEFILTCGSHIAMCARFQPLLLINYQNNRSAYNRESG
jgi:hypothetical protein